MLHSKICSVRLGRLRAAPPSAQLAGDLKFALFCAGMSLQCQTVVARDSTYYPHAKGRPRCHRPPVGRSDTPPFSCQHSRCHAVGVDIFMQHKTTILCIAAWRHSGLVADYCIKPRVPSCLCLLYRVVSRFWVFTDAAQLQFIGTRCCKSYACVTARLT
jgi:hypothetical protein